MIIIISAYCQINLGHHPKKTYENECAKIIEFFANRDIKSVTKADIKKIYDFLTDNYSKRMFDGIRKRLKAILDFAVFEELIAYNPAQQVKNYKKAKDERVETYIVQPEKYEADEDGDNLDVEIYSDEKLLRILEAMKIPYMRP